MGLPSISIFPGKYIQGNGVTVNAAHYLEPLGDTFLIIGGNRALNAVENTLIESMQGAGIRCVVEVFNGNSTQKEIDRLVLIGKQNKVRAIVGVGGGRAIDTSKAVAHCLKMPVGVVPTAASTDAPTSTVAVIYNDEGEFSHYQYFNNPDIVLVDTAIIAKSPVRFLVSGIGGAIGVSYETEACYVSKAKTTAGGSPSYMAVKCAQTARDMLFEYGYAAKLSVENGRWSPYVDMVSEANFLFSGIGFESGGLAVAHSIYHGYRSLNKRKCLHGEVVAFGTIVQMILECRSEKEVKLIIEFFNKLGLPCTLEQLGIDKNCKNELNEIANVAFEKGTAQNMVFSLKPSEIYEAIVFADIIGSDIKR